VVQVFTLGAILGVAIGLVVGHTWGKSDGTKAVQPTTQGSGTGGENR